MTRLGALNGEHGLIIAIIAVAKRDLKSENKKTRQSAKKYFQSEWYKLHLDVLGLAPDMVPEGL